MMDWAKTGETYAKKALDVIKGNSYLVKSDVIFDHYMALIDLTTPDDPALSMNWQGKRDVAMKAFEVVIRASGIPNTIFREAPKEVWTLELALAGMRSELSTCYDFVNGHKYPNPVMVNLIMKTVTNYLKLVPELDGQVIDIQPK